MNKGDKRDRCCWVSGVTEIRFGVRGYSLPPPYPQPKAQRVGEKARCGWVLGGGQRGLLGVGMVGGEMLLHHLPWPVVPCSCLMASRNTPLVGHVRSPCMAKSEVLYCSETSLATHVVVCEGRERGLTLCH